LNWLSEQLADAIGIFVQKRMKKFVTSLNDEIFDGEDFDTAEEAIGFMINDLGIGEDFYIGEPEEVTIESLIYIDQMIEDMQERAADEVGDVSEDYLMDLYRSEDKKDELNKLICDWFKKNNYEPTFFSVDNIKHYLILENKEVKRLN
jgi:hypothetical protein